MVRNRSNVPFRYPIQYSITYVNKCIFMIILKYKTWEFEKMKKCSCLIIYCILYTIQPSWSKVDLIFQTLLPVQVRPQCTVNEDCPYSDICQLGNCIDACRATKCGTNAVCASSNHRAECSCIHGFKGDPFTACRPRKMIPISLLIPYYVI